MADSTGRGDLTQSQLHGGRLTFPNQNTGQFDSHYKRGKQLGAGAFSVVIEGNRVKDNSEVAVKIVAKESTNAREMNEELTVMSKLHHVNIVNFIEIFDEAESFYVVMERVTGGELFDRIIKLQRYTERDASLVMVQALKGLKHMHEKQFVHRDIKPENLLLSSPADDASIKLADFGFSTLCEDDDELYETLGTPPYMAPELVVLRNENPADPGYNKGVDIWALGVCMYILLSGVHPFQIEDEDQMLNNIEDFQQIKWLGPNWGSVSADAKEMISQMIHRNPQTRWTVEECLNCKWINGNAPAEELSSIKDTLRQYQARKKLKGAIFGVVATNKMMNLFGPRPGAPAAATPAPNPNLTASAPKKPLDVTIREQTPIRTVSTAVGWTTLKVEIQSGAQLAPKDPNGLSDPYLKLWCGYFKYKTKIIKKTLNPVWGQTVEIPSKDAKGKSMEIECWDWDLVGGDDYMGEVSIDMDTILAEGAVGEPIKKSFNLGKPKKKSKKKQGDVSGSITLVFTKC